MVVLKIIVRTVTVRQDVVLEQGSHIHRTTLLKKEHTSVLFLTCVQERYCSAIAAIAVLN